MLKSLRVPEKLFGFAMWVVSLLFASFLSELGGKLVADLPGVDRTVTLESYIPPASLSSLRSTRSTLDVTQTDLRAQRETATLKLTTAQNASRIGQEAFDAWVATRAATTNPAQDVELLQRTRNVEALKNAERAAQIEVEGIDSQINVTVQSIDSLQTVEQQLDDAARPAFERELFQRQLKIFGIRLAMTAPLLLIAAWLVLKKRKSDYWPLARGFVLFALIAFFFELVPYLPSYGGYVRSGVGVVLTFVAGIYVIRAMRRYLAKRQQVEQQTDVERRRTLSYEDAIRKMNAGVCPGCERPIAGGTQAASNFCVHCGMNLFDNCVACAVRKNAFFQYCPECGVATAAKMESAPMSNVGSISILQPPST
jgi:predicted RNA-binding Zn-ribbon protein involved in translation (DUF1610 family)